MDKDELIQLSEEILKSIEMDEAPLSKICFKCLRLVRHLNDERGIKLFSAEISGYPKDDDGKVLRDYWNIGYKYAARGIIKKDDNGKTNKSIFIETIAELEEIIGTCRISINAARDPNIQISSANPNQYMLMPKGNQMERVKYFQLIREDTTKLSIIRGAIYKYILDINRQLKHNDVYMKLLEKNHKKSISKLCNICPDLLLEFDSIYNNIDSNNEIDLDNCVHTCRRILKTLADSLYPVDKNKKEKVVEGDKIKLLDENYINRLLAYISEKSESKTYKKIIGTSLVDVNKKMHALYDASCKGSHDNLSKYEVERYVLYTYMFLDDIAHLVD